MPSSVNAKVNASLSEVLLGNGCVNASRLFDVGNFVIRVNVGVGVGIGLGLGPGNGVAVEKGRR